MKKIFSDATGKAVGEFFENLGQGTIMEGNKPINSLFGAGEFAVRAFNNKGDDAIKAAFNSTFRETAEGPLNVGKLAGSYIGASAAYRVASGGGTTRDKNGNANLIGVPFV
jgi:hypothetical protein